ncbi:hypothetical protein FB45DRAFT_1001790 [Roridomyces roridus]|uniref:Uncharacterized protein n=1 Tax=Roridomyces roridus TaxID=1738132 RepID=A0AAD7C1X6_9AGAR|nr:hypothetical protein FB45DRAFT_1001790 [Roridomyces roridus]
MWTIFTSPWSCLEFGFRKPSSTARNTRVLGTAGLETPGHLTQTRNGATWNISCLPHRRFSDGRRIIVSSTGLVARKMIQTHRFTASFLTMLLVNGFLPANAILDDFFDNFALFPPADSDSELPELETILKEKSLRRFGLLRFSRMGERHHSSNLASLFGHQESPQTAVKESVIRATLSSLEDDKLFADGDDQDLCHQARAALKSLPNLSSKLGSFGTLRVVASFPAQTRIGRLPSSSTRYAANMNMGLFQEMHEGLNTWDMVRNLSFRIAGIQRKPDYVTIDEDSPVPVQKIRSSRAEVEHSPVRRSPRKRKAEDVADDDNEADGTDTRSPKKAKSKRKRETEEEEASDTSAAVAGDDARPKKKGRSQPAHADELPFETFSDSDESRYSGLVVHPRGYVVPARKSGFTDEQEGIQREFNATS